MVECTRCGDFVANVREGTSHYCDECLAKFAKIRQQGVVVEQFESGDYHVYVPADGVETNGRFESDQIEALVRGKYLQHEFDLTALYDFVNAGSTWILDEYLQEHPEIQQAVNERLDEISESYSSGILDPLKNLF